MDKYSVSGLYETDSGRMIMSWSELKEAYPDAFSEEGVLLPGISRDIAGDLVIDSSIKKIAYYSLFSSSELTGVYIPDSVTVIDGGAFINCYKLVNVRIPSSVKEIGYEAFLQVRHIIYDGEAGGAPWGANSMNGFVDGDFVYSDETREELWVYNGRDSVVVVPPSVKVMRQAFFNCEYVNEVHLPDGLEILGDFSFVDCSNLHSICLPEGVKHIGKMAFGRCTQLSQINIPDSVEEIDEFAFHKCTGIDKIAIPDGVKIIHQYAFDRVKRIEYHGSAAGFPWGACAGDS